MENKVATLIRIDEQLKESIEYYAEIEKRSFNKMVEYILQKYIEEQEKKDSN